MNNRFFNKLNFCLLYLVILALFGVYLRFMFVYDPGVIKFKYLLHSHSHLGMLGWVYNALYIALMYVFLPGSLNSRKYTVIFWLTQVSVIGMMFSFAVQGYAAVSISFSTLHIIMSYIFIYHFIRDTWKKHPACSVSLKFIYGGLFFMFLSSLGPWGLAAIISQGLAETDLYTQAIYFYLHFQYNGWFIFTLIGLWLSKFEAGLIDRVIKKLKPSFLILFFSNFPAYFLSLLGFNLSIVLILIAGFSALFQLYGFRLLFKILISSEKRHFANSDSIIVLLFRISFLLMFIKFILQFISIIPEIGRPAFISREVAIGYIHIVMLGVVTSGIMGWFCFNNLIKVSRGGIKIFLAGFILSELLLFYPSFVLWLAAPPVPYYSILLFSGSLLMFIGFWVIYITNILKEKSNNQDFNSLNAM